jgi:alcohol dehydrogenase
MSESLQQRATSLLKEFKGDRYAFGPTALDRAVGYLAEFGPNVVVFAGKTARSQGLLDQVARAVHSAGKVVAAVFDAARPNAPIEDVLAMADELARVPRVDCAAAIGGGSSIDALKAAVMLHSLGGKLDDYYGIGMVGKALQDRDVVLTPTVAVMTAASSAAHLTRYSNVTNLELGQKMLVIDDALVPSRAVFDYGVTTSMSKTFTLDGAFDGISHSLEVYLGAATSPAYEKIEEIALTGIDLIVTNVKRAAARPDDLDARTALGLGTDLGGYAIMTGGTSGPHLNSFSLVDLLPHGRAVAILNPYYLVLFAPACEPQLRRLVDLYARAGYLRGETARLHGRDLGLSVAAAMLSLAADVGFPTRLNDVKGFSDAHVRRCLRAAKQPQLRSKLQNMPVPITLETVDEIMGTVLEAARTGEPARVKDLS